jgi:hypothetical protein
VSGNEVIKGIIVKIMLRIRYIIDQPTLDAAEQVLGYNKTVDNMTLKSHTQQQKTRSNQAVNVARKMASSQA